MKNLNIFFTLAFLSLFFIGQSLPSTLDNYDPGSPVSSSGIFPTNSIPKKGVKSNPVSRVTITVGEKNGFAYTVEGITYSVRKVAVSGFYFNDVTNPSAGYARMFLVVESGVAYYALRPRGNLLDVYVQNYNRDEFFYTITCPSPVSSYNLYERQFNATAVLITGPSRSQV